MKEVHFHITLPARGVYFMCALVIVAAAAGALFSENITLTTVYPAPSGVYTKMITTGDTFLARNGGNVGIGTANPQSKLDVNGNTSVGGSMAIGGSVSVGGSMKIGNDAASCSTSKAGALRYNTSGRKIESCNGSAWKEFASDSLYPTGAVSGYISNCTGGVVSLNSVLPAGKRVLSLVVVPVHEFDNDPHPEGFQGLSGTISSDGRTIWLPNMCTTMNPFFNYQESGSAIEWHVTY